VTDGELIQRRSFIRQLMTTVAAGAGFLLLGARRAEAAGCTCCVNCMACNCGGCARGKAKYRCVRAGCSYCTSCMAAGGCYTVPVCC
jgi:hypothetical protein